MPEQTPSYLLDALNMITARRVPIAKARSGVESLHVDRVRDVFEDKNIVAIGISEKITEKKSTGQLSLCFYVEKKIPKSKMKLNRYVPPVIASRTGRAVFTDVKPLGEIRPEAVSKKARPIQSGFSIGHVKTTAGTLGAIVRKGSKHYVLSNSHVLALSGTGKKGDQIIYPAKADGGTPTKNQIARLAQFQPFKTGGDFVNRFDAAIAEIAADREADLDFRLFGVKGFPSVIEPQRGMVVVKHGRTTGKTEGVVTDVNFRLVLNYDEVGEIGFVDQVLCTRYTRPGDSGSLVVDKKSGRIVGLHFAGAEGGSVFSSMKAVVRAFGFKFIAT